MAGALPVIRKGFTRKAAGTKYGRYQGVTCHFFRHVQKSGKGKASHCRAFSRMGTKAAVRNFKKFFYMPMAWSAKRKRSSPRLPMPAGNGITQPGRKALCRIS
jgi:hypothetical protein